MKIALSATAPGLDADIDPRFGRCQYFIVVDPATMEFETLGNPNVSGLSGVGVSSAQLIANKGAGVVLTGNCGPKAYQTLSAVGIQVITGVVGKVRDAIESYKAGQLGVTPQPTVDAHFGMGMGRGVGTMPMVGPASQSASSEHEVEALKAQSQVLLQQLRQVQQRIEELEKKKS